MTAALVLVPAPNHVLEQFLFASNLLVYHPNIDAEGEIFLDMLKSNWTPAIRISTVLLTIVSLLYNPLLDLPFRHDVARQYCHEWALFEEMGRGCTRRHASAPVVSFYPAGEEGDSMGRSSRLQHRESCWSGWRFFNLLVRPLWAADR